MKWSFEKIGNLCRIKHGFAFKGEFFTDSGEFILLTPGNFNETGGLKLKGDKEKYYRGEIPADFILEEGDLLIVLTDLMQNAPILGGAAFIPVSNRFLHNQRLGKVEHLNLSRIDAKFFFYCLNDESYRGQVRSSATGSTVRHSAPERVYNCQIPLPPLPTQQKIAAILSAYDDLIENNLRRIRLLEEAAQHLYREWFVRFRFPGWEEVKVVDGLPEGWEFKKAEEIFSINIGKTPPRNEAEWFEDGKSEIKWVSIKDMNNSSAFVLETSESITTQGVDKFNMNVAPKGTVILSFKLTIGAVAIVEEDMVTNEAIAHFNILDKEAMNNFFAYCYLKNFNYETLGSTSSIGRALNSKIVKSMPFLLPDQSVIQLFGSISAGFFAQIRNLLIQNQKLKEARDILLPRLMNQTIEV